MGLAEFAKAAIPKPILKHYGLILPISAMSLILILLIPLPTVIMDFLLLVNITLSAIVLVTVMYIKGPLEFSSFPSLLLGMTMFRLVLNTATTRLILTNGDAGQVISTFGQFVSRGSLVVAVIIFAIIVVIQFVVITKGATRIAEVAARFTLDGMPGKQMAVDADLNAGTITEDQAKQRREEITREADFYGAMDGASKFVRGDAIAGIIITGINILGGIYVGLVEQDLAIGETLRKFTILTIGDGLVSQIPAFIIAASAAMLVTRSAEQRSLGDELFKQVLGQPIALIIAAGFLPVLPLTPLPKTPLFLLMISCYVAAQLLTQNQKTLDLQAATAQAKPSASDRVESHLSPDPMELNVGYGLLGLVDRKQGGDLLARITNMRRQIAQELGIVVPPIRIRDDIKLQANEFCVNLKGISIGRSEVLPGHLMAIDAGTVSDRIHGMETKEPAFGLPAVWIEESQRHEAEHRNYTVVEPSSVIATFLTELIKRHAEELLTRQEVNRLLDHLRQRAAKLVEEVVPDVLKPGEIQRILQALLHERVPIGDLETILEAAADVAVRTKDTEILVEYARHALSRAICHQYADDKNRVHCVTLDAALEEVIANGLSRSDHGAVMTLPPAMQTRIVDALASKVEEVSPLTGGRLPVVLCPPQIRLWVRKMIEVRLPTVPVLSYNEMARGFEVESHGLVVLTDES